MIGRGGLWWLSTLMGGVLGVALTGALVWGLHGFGHRPADLHTLLHETVPLDADEQRALDAKEQIFLKQRELIEARLRDANRQLADAIAANPHWSPAVEAAAQQVEQAAADLQRATLVHVFEMREGLKPEHRAAYDRALVNALRRGSQ
ncbi:MAG: NAD+ synthetase [Rhodanobacter sp. 68-29]|nr:periplasmic heavy metal sensor [Rhodanobacter sp.]OJY56254.1 MAG: NAD+ synthetase [Rhodanobacter sp. 68-29]